MSLVIRFEPGLRPVFKHAMHDQKTHGSWAGVSGLATLGAELLSSEQIKDFDNLIKKVPQSHIEALRASGTKIRIMDSPKVMSRDEAPHFNRSDNEIRLDKNTGADALLHEIGHALDFNAKSGNGFLSDDPSFRKIIKESKFPDFANIPRSSYPFARSEEFAVAYENYYSDGGKFIGAKPTNQFKQVMEGIGEYILSERVNKHQEHDQSSHGNWADSIGIYPDEEYNRLFEEWRVASKALRAYTNPKNMFSWAEMNADPIAQPLKAKADALWEARGDVSNKFYDEYFQTNIVDQKDFDQWRDEYVVADTPTLSMNRGLRGGRTVLTQRARNAEAMCDSGTVKKDVGVFRGAILPEAMVAGLKVGKSFMDKGFQSADVDKSSAKFYAEQRQDDGASGVPVLFRMILSKGVNAVDVGYGEVVIQRNSTMTVTGKRKRGKYTEIDVRVTK